jgi:ABC-2 type transport system ATP-binding protein
VAIISQGTLVAIDTPEKLKMATSGLHSVEVSFDEIAEVESLVNLPGVSTVKKIGDKFKVFTADPGKLVTILANYSASNNLKIISLNTLSPSLEDAFVALVGKETK